MRQVVTLLIVFVVMAPSCGRGYTGENRSLVQELPVLEGVVMLDEEHYSYCSQDTCTFGNDRSGALLTYAVDITTLDQETLIDAYQERLPSWELSTSEGSCDAADDPALCDQIVTAVFVREDEEISLNLDNWTVGQFEIHVDARGNE